MIHKIRHKIVKILAPKIYGDHLLYSQLVTRPMIEAIQQTKMKELIGAEIGVAKGINALRILQTLPMKKLFLIDPFLDYYNLGKTVDMRPKYEQAKQRLRDYPQAVFLRKTSEQAVNELPELDFVYIDGLHTYEGCKRDIELYYPIVKNGGFLGGHDFYGSFQGVIWAVIEFVKNNDLELHTDFYDWWIQKP